MQNLPVSASGTATLPWVKAHIPWLFGTTSGPSPYDTANISVDAFLGKDLDAQDPFVTNPDSAPTGFALVQLTQELLSGSVTKWMEGNGVFAAGILLAFRLRYTGSDALTTALFQTDPSNPGTRIEYVKVTGTNADTMTYKQLTSLQASEAVPVGLAEALFNASSVLHWEGDIMFKEPECSGQLRVGNVFNTSDGRVEWQTMNAQVLSVDEDIDKGTTTVRFGPPVMLGAQDRTELLRAAQGRVPTFKLDQKATGQSGNGNAIIGHTRVPAHAGFSPPVPQAVQAGPFAVEWGPDPAGAPGTFRYRVGVIGVLQASTASPDNISIDDLNEWNNLNANDTIWLFANVSEYSVSGNASIHSFGKGDSDYNPAAGIWATGGPVEYDGSNVQTLFRKPIVTFVADGAGKPSVSKVFTNTSLIVQNYQQGGYPSIYPLPL